MRGDCLFVCLLILFWFWFWVFFNKLFAPSSCVVSLLTSKTSLISFFLFCFFALLCFCLVFFFLGGGVFFG